MAENINVNLSTIYQKITTTYEMPICPTCDSYMQLGEITNITTHKRKKGFENGEISFILHCENSACPEGIIHTHSYKLYNPMTHYIRKRKTPLKDKFKNFLNL